MEKTIEICGKKYQMKSSVLTLETYQRLYDKDLMQEVVKLKDAYKDTISKENAICYLQPIVLELLRIAHIMIQEKEPSFMEYNEWVSSLEGILDKPNWILEVLEVAMSPFRTGIFKK